MLQKPRPKPTTDAPSPAHTGPLPGVIAIRIALPSTTLAPPIIAEMRKLVRMMTDNEEGKFVADTIQEQRLRNHYNNRDFAILYRTNAQSRAFEESLRRMAIPYTMFGGISFYSRKEIKDFVSGIQDGSATNAASYAANEILKRDKVENELS